MTLLIDYFKKDLESKNTIDMNNYKLTNDSLNSSMNNSGVQGRKFRIQSDWSDTGKLLLL
jgi:hypothetical protein